MGSNNLTLAQDEYNRIHGRRYLAAFDLAISITTVGLLIFCFIVSPLHFFIVVGLLVMMAGTILGAGRLFVVFRFPLKANRIRLAMGLTLTVIGTLIYIGVSSAEDTWRTMAAVAVGTEFIHICCCGFGVWWASHLPEFDPNAVGQTQEVEFDMSLVPEVPVDDVKGIEENGDENVESEDGSERGGSEGPESAVGNLPRGGPVEFPHEEVPGAVR
jgi:hypothetical protein